MVTLDLDLGTMFRSVRLRKCISREFLSLVYIYLIILEQGYKYTLLLPPAFGSTTAMFIYGLGARQNCKL